VHFKLSQEALDKLLNYKGDINNIKSIIEKAAFFASTLYATEAASQITIEDSYLNTGIQAVQTSKQSDEEYSIREHRYTKTRSILDEMEYTARKLQEQEQKLTSTNLARALPHPKSAAAISDQLSKHRDRIIKLFDSHPNDWAIIRKSFRPIQNIINQ